MTTAEELVELANKCEAIAAIGRNGSLAKAMEALDGAIAKIAESSSNSWLGYQSCVYYRGFQRPAPGDYFTQEWGFNSVFAAPVSENWAEVEYDEVREAIMRLAGQPDTDAIEQAGSRAREAFERHRDELVVILTILIEQTHAATLEELRDEAKKLKSFNATQILDNLAPTSFRTRDSIAADQGRRPPHHVRVSAWLAEHRLPFKNLEAIATLARRAASYLSRRATVRASAAASEHCVFVGHGRDPQWKDISEFLSRRLRLTVEEFNRESAAGLTTTERLQQMLAKATFAFLIMTAEDEHADATKHARENVIHEIGLFQQKLGNRRAIILLEEGCREFSNIAGVVQVHFPKDYIKATFEEIRQVLEREGVLPEG
jgi:predicted nucleotide-binding protein